MKRRSLGTNAAHGKAPGFFWQGVLILLPVIVLAGAGAISIRQDRVFARHEAVERAQTLSEEMADALWTKLTESDALERFRQHTFRVDDSGNLLFPPPAPELPVPFVLDESVLSPAQRALWAEIRSSGATPSPPPQLIETFKRFLALSPPDEFSSIARFSLAQLLSAHKRTDEARSLFAEIRDRHPEAKTESGLPLQPLAELKLLELGSPTTGAIALNAFCSNLIFRPTFLTERLLERATELEPLLSVTNIVRPWIEEWRRHEPLRLLAQAAQKSWSTSTVLKGTTADGKATNLSVPALSWFTEFDTSPVPQPVFPPPKEANLAKGPVRSHANNLVASVVGEKGWPDPEPSPSLPPSGNGQTIFWEYPREWLATRLGTASSGYNIVCRVMGLAGVSPRFAVRSHEVATGPRLIGSPAWLELRESMPQLPPWLGATIDLAGVPLLTTNDLHGMTYMTVGKGSGQAWMKTGAIQLELLATAARFESGIERLRVNIHLTAPDLLYSRHQARSLLFSLLILASVIAATVGFVSARHAFLRQQQLGEMKSNFVSSVSHELRAPIASMRLLAESLASGRIAEPAKQNEYFRFIVQECRRLSSLIENVLNFARIEQGRKRYEFEPTDLSALINKTIMLLQPVADEKRVALRVEVPDEVRAAWPTPIIDGAAIQQALVNLLDNAVKHSPPDSTVTVGLATTRSSASALDSSATGESSPCVRLWVQDRGPGIPAEERDRIFERFYRPGSEMRRETQGVGICLSIVKHIVEAHRGRMLVESEVGQGSTFVIELPLPPGPTLEETKGG